MGGSGKVWIRLTCASAPQMASSPPACPKGSRLERTVPLKMTGSCGGHSIGRQIEVGGLVLSAQRAKGSGFERTVPLLKRPDCAAGGAVAVQKKRHKCPGS